MTFSNSEEDQQLQLTRAGSVWVLTLTGRPHKANVFSIPLLQRLDALLDQVEANLPGALIITGAQGSKFFSAGFDLQALTGQGHAKTNSKGGKRNNNSNSINNQPRTKTPQGQDLVNYSWQVLARLLVFPAPTIAVINGHAFGLGLFLALACDHRVMLKSTAEKGRLCLPEITIGLPLGSGFAALAKGKLTANTLRTAALTGKQWTAKEALQAGMIDAIVHDDKDDNVQPLPAFILKMAEQLVSTSKKGNLPKIKMELYRETYQGLLVNSNSQQSKL